MNPLTLPRLLVLYAVALAAVGHAIDVRQENRILARKKVNAVQVHMDHSVRTPESVRFAERLAAELARADIRQAPPIFRRPSPPPVVHVPPPASTRQPATLPRPPSA